MRNNSESTYFYESSLFKTTEYHLSSDNKLYIKEISYTGRLKKNVFSLDKIKPIQNIVSFRIPVLLFLLSVVGCASLILNWNTINNNQLAIASSLLIFVSLVATLYSSTNARTKHTYEDAFTEKFLFSLGIQRSFSHSKTTFIEELNKKITEAEKEHVIENNFIDFTSRQRILNNEHLDALYNSGMVDENTYNTISNNINNRSSEDLLNLDFRPLADVIYLSSGR